ncbi:MAG: transcriptional regulator [Alphaproteobacteria bacterium HGW-Alphaproteobacteria-7]|nr:MAG: transcriptional regulator [Alphaproteobacteria bacterium HGW-Alphaproteobacteria-7]
MDVNLALSPQAIAFARFDSKPKVLSKIAQLLADAYGLDVGEVLEGLEAREALGSTGFGRGVAIPHCRSKTVRRPSLALIRLEAPIDYAAADALPVTLVCGLVSPENAGATHLHALAAISRLTRDETMLQMLADAPTTEAVYALLTNQFLRDAA